MASLHLLASTLLTAATPGPLPAEPRLDGLIRGVAVPQTGESYPIATRPAGAAPGAPADITAHAQLDLGKYPGRPGPVPTYPQIAFAEEGVTVAVIPLNDQGRPVREGIVIYRGVVDFAKSQALLRTGLAGLKAADPTATAYAGHPPGTYDVRVVARVRIVHAPAPGRLVPRVEVRDATLVATVVVPPVVAEPKG